MAGSPRGGRKKAAALLAALRPHLAAAGITRVGDLTDLDVIGLPVAFAARPNSRSLSVTQGKALHLEEAMLGAVMEAFEQAYAESAEVVACVHGTRPELLARGYTPLDLSTFARVVRSQTNQESMTWMPVSSLLTGTCGYVPFELVGLDLRADAGWRFDTMPVSSLGLAAGPSLEAAVTHALLEVLEHNATSALDIFGFVPGFSREIEYRPGLDVNLDEVVSRIAAANLSFQLFDISCPGGPPVVGALLNSTDLGSHPIKFAGFACRFSAERAAEAALLEAVQSRLTLIAGARDDLKPSSYTGHPTHSRTRAHRKIYLDELPRDYAVWEQATAAKRMRAAVAAAVNLGAADVYVADLGGIEGLVSVARVVVPGVEASGFNATAILGLRTLTALLEEAHP